MKAGVDPVSRLARATSHGSHRDGRGGWAGDVRAGESRARSRLYDRAVLAREHDEYPDAAELAEARLFATSGTAR